MSNLTDFVAALKSAVNAGDVSTLIAGRFTPIPIPEDCAKPCATYTIIQTVPPTTLGDGDDDGLLAVSIEIDAWAESFDAALALAEAIRARMVTASFKSTPEQSDGNGCHVYEHEARLHRFHWRYTCWFST